MVSNSKDRNTASRIYKRCEPRSHSSFSQLFCNQVWHEDSKGFKCCQGINLLYLHQQHIFYHTATAVCILAARDASEIVHQHGNDKNFLTYQINKHLENLEF